MKWRHSGCALILMAMLSSCGLRPGSDAMDAVRHEMIDPDAAQFREVSQCPGDRTVWRGEVNGKNRLGAYTGFKSFFFADGMVTYLESPGAAGMIDRCFGKSPQAAPSPAPAKPVAAKPAPKPSPTAKAPFDVAATEYDGAETGPSTVQDRCWADYCPCDKSNLDYGFLDVTLCRKIRMGSSVSTAEFEIGASGRDARRALREHKDQYGGDY